MECLDHYDYELLHRNGNLAALAVLVLMLGWETFSPFFAFFRQRVRERFVHGLLNMVLGFVNATMVAVVFVALWLGAAKFVADHGVGILHWVALPKWAEAIVAVLLLDFWTYWWHRINHRIPLLWRFHRVHHSDAQMDVTTASRFHLGEILASSVLRVPLIVLFGAQLWHVALYETVMFPIVQFHHANIGLSPRLDRWLRVLIVTPAMHKVHHSRVQVETDSNYTSMLSIWDRLFGSFRLRADPHSIELGLDRFDDADHQSLTGLFKTPLDRQ